MADTKGVSLSESAIPSRQEQYDTLKEKYKWNPRIEYLSTQVGYKCSPKYASPRFRGTKGILVSGISEAALNPKCTDRLRDLAIPYRRKLEDNRNMFKDLRGQAFVDRMNKKIAQAYETIYNEFQRAKDEKEKKLKLRQKASKKSIKKKTKSAEDRQLWLSSRAAPKKVHEPPPLPKSKRQPLKKLKKRLKTLASPLPRKIYKLPWEEPGYKDPRTVKRSCLTYQASERVKVLSKPPNRYLIRDKPWTPSVSRGALKAKLTPRSEKLATPKPRLAAVDGDLKEDPYSVSPNALKYKASARIKKLAKPKERS